MAANFGMLYQACPNIWLQILECKRTKEEFGHSLNFISETEYYRHDRLEKSNENRTVYATILNYAGWS